MARKSLDDILDGNDEPEVEAEAVEAQPEQPEATEPEPQPRDESGKFAAKGETEPQPEEPQEEPPSSKPDAGVLAAKRAETERRQAAEKERDDFARQLEALRSEIQQQQKPQEPEAPPPSVWEDENAWGGQLVSQAVQQSAYQAKLQMSEMLMSEQAEDFADIKQQLVEFVGSNPAINQQVAESQHPWRTAYQAFKSQRTMQELGATDVDTLRAKLREEILAELQANAPVEQPKVPPSLSTKRNVGSRSGPNWTGPTPLGDLIGN